MQIELRNVTYKYSDAGRSVLDNINLTLDTKDFTAIVGPTGSGKSTLIQHLNLLLTATSGEVYCDGANVYANDFDKRNFRFKVGMVFQYPEYQLFESTVLDDVSFGPKNLGLDSEEVLRRAERALDIVGIPSELRSRSPFELSGGQKRRVALAGVLAMQPEFLVLDEPASGLDPAGKKDMLDLMKKLHEENGIGIILVSHSMDDVASYADRLVVLSHGRIEMDGSPKQVFAQHEEIRELGLDIPDMMKILIALKARGVAVDDTVITLDEAVKAILTAAGRITS